MDLRVIDARIEPLLCRIACDLQKVPLDPVTRLPKDPRLEAPTDDSAFLAYSAAERDTIHAALLAAKLAYQTVPADQPDPAILAACQGKVRSRTEALAALAAGRAPVTLADLSARVTQLETATPVAVETGL